MGDILACSAEGALSYRWTNGAGVLTYGQTVSIAQPGSFTYECSVLMDCGPGLNCPFSRNISGFARGIVDLHYFFLTSRIVVFVFVAFISEMALLQLAFEAFGIINMTSQQTDFLSLSRFA